MMKSFTIPTFLPRIPWTRSSPDIGKGMGMRMVMDMGKGKVTDADVHANAHSDTYHSCRHVVLPQLVLPSRRRSLFHLPSKQVYLFSFSSKVKIVYPIIYKTHSHH